MSLSNLEIGELLFEATVRMETIIHIAGIGDPDDLGHFGPIRDFIDELDERVVEGLKADMPFLEAILDPEEGVSDEAQEGFFHLVRDHGKWGFLVQVAHPEMSFTKGRDGASFTWGAYHTAWVYGETLEEVATKAVAWSEKLDAEAKALVEARA